MAKNITKQNKTKQKTKQNETKKQKQNKNQTKTRTWLSSLFTLYQWFTPHRMPRLYGLYM